MSEPTFTGKLVWPEGRDPQVLVDALGRIRGDALRAIQEWMMSSYVTAELSEIAKTAESAIEEWGAKSTKPGKR